MSVAYPPYDHPQMPTREASRNWNLSSSCLVTAIWSSTSTVPSVWYSWKRYSVLWKPEPRPSMHTHTMP